MTEILTAIITLLGTLAVAGLGFLQWQRMQMKDRQKGYHDQRVEALSSVWDILTDVEATQRTDMNENREPQRTEPLRRVNLLLLRAAPFLLEDERDWAVTMVQEIIEVDTLMRILRRTRPRDAEWWGLTMDQPLEMTELLQVVGRLSAVKEKLAARYGAVMRGEHV